jgi:hypothetical protein
MFKLYHLTKIIKYFKTSFKNVSPLNLNSNEKFMKCFFNIMHLQKPADRNENIIWNNNEHLIFYKIINQIKIHFKLFDSLKWIYFVDKIKHYSLYIYITLELV